PGRMAFVGSGGPGAYAGNGRTWVSTRSLHDALPIAAGAGGAGGNGGSADGTGGSGGAGGAAIGGDTGTITVTADGIENGISITSDRGGRRLDSSDEGGSDAVGCSGSGSAGGYGGNGG